MLTCPQLPVLGSIIQLPLLAKMNTEYLTFARNLLTTIPLEVVLNSLPSTLLRAPRVAVRLLMTSIFPLVVKLLVPRIQGVASAVRNVTLLDRALWAKAVQCVAGTRRCDTNVPVKLPDFLSRVLVTAGLTIVTRSAALLVVKVLQTFSMSGLLGFIMITLTVPLT